MTVEGAFHPLTVPGFARVTSPPLRGGEERAPSKAGFAVATPAFASGHFKEHGKRGALSVPLKFFIGAAQRAPPEAVPTSAGHLGPSSIPAAPNEGGGLGRAGGRNPSGFSAVSAMPALTQHPFFRRRPHKGGDRLSRLGSPSWGRCRSIPLRRGLHRSGARCSRRPSSRNRRRCWRRAASQPSCRR